MIDEKLLIDEIDRRIKAIEKIKLNDIAGRDELIYIKGFIDSMPKEPVNHNKLNIMLDEALSNETSETWNERLNEEPANNNLEKELDKYLQANFTIDKEQLDRFGIEEKDYMYSMDKSDMLALVKHFINWHKTKEEPVSEEFEKKFISFVNATHDNNGSYSLHDFAQRLYNIAKEELKESVSEDRMTIRKEWFEHCKKSWYNEGYIDGKYNRDRQFKESVSEDLEEAMQHNAPDNIGIDDLLYWRNGFIAGAKWQKEQFKNALDLIIELVEDDPSKLCEVVDAHYPNWCENNCENFNRDCLMKYLKHYKKEGINKL